MSKQRAEGNLGKQESLSKAKKLPVNALVGLKFCMEYSLHHVHVYDILTYNISSTFYHPWICTKAVVIKLTVSQIRPHPLFSLWLPFL